MIVTNLNGECQVACLGPNIFLIAVGSSARNGLSVDTLDRTRELHYLARQPKRDSVFGSIQA